MRGSGGHGHGSWMVMCYTFLESWGCHECVRVAFKLFWSSKMSWEEKTWQWVRSQLVSVEIWNFGFLDFWVFSFGKIKKKYPRVLPWSQGFQKCIISGVLSDFEFCNSGGGVSRVYYPVTWSKIDFIWKMKWYSLMAYIKDIKSQNFNKNR